MYDITYPLFLNEVGIRSNAGCSSWFKAENDEMMASLKDYGCHITSKLEAGVYHVTFSIVREGSR